MQYKVIEFFTDLQDFNHPYNAGDLFPRTGKVVSEERLRELSGFQNRQRRPLIEPVIDAFGYAENNVPDAPGNAEKEPETKQYTKTEIKRMSTAELQNLAATVGVENAFGRSGGELKEILIRKFNL